MTLLGTYEETLALMRAMASAGELSALVPARVWQESARGLMTEQPSRMFDVLQEAQALPVLFEPLSVARVDPSLAQLLDRAALAGLALDQRFAVLRHLLGPDVPNLSQRWRVPTECRAWPNWLPVNEAHFAIRKACWPRS